MCTRYSYYYEGHHCLWNPLGVWIIMNGTFINIIKLRYANNSLLRDVQVTDIYSLKNKIQTYQLKVD